MTVGPVNVEYRAITHEDVSSCGTWKAFKIESEAASSAFSTIWYAPDLKLIVNESTRPSATVGPHEVGR